MFQYFIKSAPFRINSFHSLAIIFVILPLVILLIIFKTSSNKTRVKFSSISTFSPRLGLFLFSFYSSSFSASSFCPDYYQHD